MHKKWESETRTSASGTINKQTFIYSTIDFVHVLRSLLLSFAYILFLFENVLSQFYSIIFIRCDTIFLYFHFEINEMTTMNIGFLSEQWKNSGLNANEFSCLCVICPGSVFLLCGPLFWQHLSNNKEEKKKEEENDAMEN